MQIFGLILTLSASLLVIYKGSIIKSFNSSVVYILLACVFTTFSSIADKVIVNHFSPFTYVFVNNLFIGMVFAFNKQNITDVVKIIKNDFRLLFASSFFMTAGFVLILITLKLHDVSKTLPAFSGLGLISTVLLGIVFLGERQNVIKKLLATISIILGSYLLFA